MPPPDYYQPALCDAVRTLQQRGIEGLARRADPHLAAWVEQFTREHAIRYTWSHELTSRVRTGVNILLGFLQAPGAQLAAADVAVLTEANLPHVHVSTVLKRAGLLTDDRVPAVLAWGEQHITALPSPMAGEVRAWLSTMHHGSTIPPRRHPRSETTIRLHLHWALPALTHWAAHGTTSLREITPDDIRAVLPPTAAARRQMGQGLRSLYRVLKAQRIVFTNPAAQVKTAFPDPTIPLPLHTEHIRAALDSADPVQALLSALIAFHGLTAHQLQHPPPHSYPRRPPRRRQPLGPARRPCARRLAAYLDHRRRQWPTTANPYLLVHFRTATTGAPVGCRWINLRLGPHLTTRSLRDDRLLDEALATDGDVKRLAALFAISPRTAQRYTQHLTSPSLQGSSMHDCVPP